MSVRRSFGAISCAIVVVVMAAGACSSDSNNEPAIADGSDNERSTEFTVGFTNPLGQSEILGDVQRALEARAEVLGIKLVPLDSQGDPNKQVSDIDQFVIQGVDGIIVWPLVPGTLDASLDRAAEAGIKLVGINEGLGSNETSFPPFDAIVNQPLEEQAALLAAKLSEELPDGAKVLGLGFAVPVPTLEYQMEQFEEKVESAGLEWVGRVNTPTDDPAGAQPVVEDALTRFPEVDAIVVFSDASAAGALAAVRQSGRDILIAGAAGESVGFEAVERGSQFLTFDLVPWVQGVTWMNVMAALLNGEDVEPVSVTKVQLVTKENVSERLDPAEAESMIRAGELTSQDDYRE